MKQMSGVTPAPIGAGARLPTYSCQILPRL